MRIERSCKWLVLLPVLLFAGCSTTPKTDTGADYAPYDQTTGDVVDNKIRHAIGNPAVVDLWNQSEAARGNGDYDTAILLLERALRIEPNDAVMWSRLAEIQLQKQNANQAENFAAKSNTISIDNPVLNYRNWLIIAKARELKGDDIGAQEARYTANSFKP